MAAFPPNEIKDILRVVTGLLRERGESVGVGETVSFFGFFFGLGFLSLLYRIFGSV